MSLVLHTRFVAWHERRAVAPTEGRQDLQLLHGQAWKLDSMRQQGSGQQRMITEEGGCHAVHVWVVTERESRSHPDQPPRLHWLGVFVEIIRLVGRIFDLNGILELNEGLDYAPNSLASLVVPCSRTARWSARGPNEPGHRRGAGGSGMLQRADQRIKGSP
eukprot:scaffold8602_cov277-Pinguiococcus_pyrenoidosus.AAC.5